MSDAKPQTDPTTDQEWIVAALEAIGWKKCEVADYESECWESPDGRHTSNGCADLPDLHSVDACLKHLVPVMDEKEWRMIVHRLRLIQGFSVRKWEVALMRDDTLDCVSLEVDPNLALAIVKAFVRAMKGAKE